MVGRRFDKTLRAGFVLGFCALIPTATVATVVFNPGEEAKTVRLDYCSSGAGVELPARSIATFVAKV